MKLTGFHFLVDDDTQAGGRATALPVSVPETNAGCPISRCFWRDVGYRKPSPQACCGPHRSTRAPVCDTIVRAATFHATMKVALARLGPCKTHPPENPQLFSPCFSRWDRSWHEPRSR